MGSAWLAGTEASLPNGLFMDNCISLDSIHKTGFQLHPGRSQVKRWRTLLLEIWTFRDLYRMKDTRRRGRGNKRDER